MKKYKMNAQEREVYDELPKEEKKLYAYMTHKQRKKYSMMTGEKAKKYMYACKTKNEEYTGADAKKEMKELADSMDEGVLSQRVSKENLQEKTHFCKYCGQGFHSEEEVDKHQRTCSLTI
jgi:hypothetical protein